MLNLIVFLNMAFPVAAFEIPYGILSKSTGLSNIWPMIRSCTEEYLGSVTMWLSV
jgi:hypothetical protein